MVSKNPETQMTKFLSKYADAYQNYLPFQNLRHKYPANALPNISPKIKGGLARIFSISLQGTYK